MAEGETKAPAKTEPGSMPTVSEGKEARHPLGDAQHRRAHLMQ